MSSIVPIGQDVFLTESFLYFVVGRGLTLQIKSFCFSCTCGSCSGIQLVCIFEVGKGSSVVTTGDIEGYLPTLFITGSKEQNFAQNLVDRAH